MNTSLGVINSQVTMQFTRQLVSTDSSGQDVNIDVPRVWIWALGTINNNGTLNVHVQRGALNNNNTVSLSTSCQSKIALDF